VHGLQIVDQAITGEWFAEDLDWKSVRLGIPKQRFFDNLNPETEFVIKSAIGKLWNSGC